MVKFLIGAVCGAGLLYYCQNRQPETEAKVKTEVTHRAAMITKIGEK
jgi:hypothetical protein